MIQCVVAFENCSLDRRCGAVHDRIGISKRKRSAAERELLGIGTCCGTSVKGKGCWGTLLFCKVTQWNVVVALAPLRL